MQRDLAHRAHALNCGDANASCRSAIGRLIEVLHHIEEIVEEVVGWGTIGDEANAAGISGRREIAEARGEIGRR